MIAVMREFGSGGDLRWAARFGPDNVVQSYRGFKQVWHGYPTYPPSLVVEKGKGGCFIGYVSWNGATDVYAWAVYVGDSVGDLAFVGKVRKRGFETEFQVGGAYVQVAAVDALGRIGLRSRVAYAA